MTKLDYLENTALFESEAVVLEMKEGEKGKMISLDRTIFYPQGGGQPADHGEICSGDRIFKVNDVRIDETGIVWHFGEYTSEEFNLGEKVILKIDQLRRMLNAKIHSAGHLLDCAVTNMKLDNLIPTKGFHFPDGPYVEYDGVVESPVDMIPVLQKNIDDLIARDVKVEKKDISEEEARSIGMHIPFGKSARVVNFEGYAGCGCGGTHVNSAIEIGKIIIRKIKSSQGKTKISYSVE
jgi:Ser-tRNA(Ala) deacylase AlaX